MCINLVLFQPGHKPHGSHSIATAARPMTEQMHHLCKERPSAARGLHPGHRQLENGSDAQGPGVQAPPSPPDTPQRGTSPRTSSVFKAIEQKAP